MNTIKMLYRLSSLALILSGAFGGRISSIQANSANSEPPNQDLQTALIWVLNDYSGIYHQIFVSGACIPIPLTGNIPIINPIPDPWINSPTPPEAGYPTGGIMAPSPCQGILPYVPGRYLKVSQVRLDGNGADSEYLYVSFDLKKRVTQGIPQYTVGGKASGKFHLTNIQPNEVCIQPTSGGTESLDITSLTIDDSYFVRMSLEDRLNLEAAIKRMYPKQFCVPRPPEPAITIRNAGSEECYGGYKPGNTVAHFKVHLSNRYTRPVSFAYQTENRTASGGIGPGNDYYAVSGTLTIPIGQTTADIPVTVVCDTRVEGDEAFLVRLSSPNNATITDGEANGMIIDRQETP